MIQGRVATALVGALRVGARVVLDDDPEIEDALVGLLPYVFPQLDFIEDYLFRPFDRIDEGIAKAIDYDPEGIIAFLLNEHLGKALLFIVGGLLIAVFVGRAWSRSEALQAVGMQDGWIARAWFFLLRYLSPLLILLMLLGLATE